jgi:hypothetical protein
MLLRGRENGGPRSALLDRRYKTISSADDRLNKTRLLRIISKHLPNPANYGIDAVVDVKEHILAPDPLRDPLPGNQLTWMFHQKQKKVHRNTCQSESPA